MAHFISVLHTAFRSRQRIGEDMIAITVRYAAIFRERRSVPLDGRKKRPINAVPIRHEQLAGN